MNIEWIYSCEHAAHCFFRSALKPPEQKVMLQITTRCNMHCKHCFLSASNAGFDLPYNNFDAILSKFVRSNVKKVTLTGGEPLLHPKITDMVAALDAVGIQTCICTNASLISDSLLMEMGKYNIHFNVSLDGVLPGSHGTFREISSPDGFDQIMKNIALIGQYGLLNGVLATPNKLAAPEEYVAICDFARKSGARYFLLNPLSPFGRGKTADSLTLSSDELDEIRQLLDANIKSQGTNDSFRVVYIRFPGVPSSGSPACSAGLIPYIFTNGDIAICPYMVFAAENPDNDYHPTNFIIGNIYQTGTISEAISAYRNSHRFCQRGEKENIGCVAMKIARNIPLDGEDSL